MNRLYFVFIFTVFFNQAAFSNTCEHVFKKSLSGNSRIEHLFGQTAHIIDKSHLAIERTSFNSPDIQVVNFSDAFSNSDVLLGFGRPNVFLTLPRENQTPLRFAAKSVKRADSKIEDTKGRIQSGVFIVFKDMTTNMVENIYTAAKEHEGSRRWTCVNANCRVLEDAGFRFGSKPPSDIYFPVSLLRTILHNGIQYKGKDVEYELVRTTPIYLEKFGLSVIKSELLTLCRHSKRACSSWAEKNNFIAYLLRVKEATGNHLALWLGKSSAKPKKLPIEPQPRLDITENEGPTFNLNVSQASNFGIALRLLWGAHTLFELPIKDEPIDHFLPDTLTEFPQENSDLLTRAKKNVLFSRPVVSGIRSQLSKFYQTYNDLTQAQLYSMLRASSNQLEHKYNIVITKDKIIVLKIDIQAKYVDWILSKHVLLANYSKHVRFAGEIWKGEDGTIYLNNNSGTYQPNTEQLEQAVLFLRGLTPDVDIQAAPME